MTTSRRALAMLVVAVGLVAGCADGPASLSPSAAGASPSSSSASSSAVVKRTPSPRPSATPGATPRDVWTDLHPTGHTDRATVVRIVDGDTIIVAMAGHTYRLRYIGMNTPEDVKPDTPVQYLSREAAAANKTLVDGKDVILEREVSNTDQYGRLLRDVWIDDGLGHTLLVGLELVRTGYAQIDTVPPDVRYVSQILAAERAARKAGIGLWSPDAP